ncbi:MAG: hypothetical protein MUF45_13430 [Spirosomaceae bacterium]|jgi:PBP1b-binding outer membrane lipoprotein LpoB|nr:hypothetical protein [Spirosomataceae bacterium]
MKKLIFAVLISSFVLNGCKKEETVSVNNCEASSKQFTDAANAWISDFNNKTKCQAYIDAAKKLINTCPTISAADKKAANDAINQTKCN